ncbi:flavin-containing monooxygenase [Nocardia wallacei]|uniref:flavin-containing monooxygenase n=1 Tax=Nocardia wallacei TaxID=480035 RepID=UPI0024558E42|nr:NAD(P)/FAD-dependent oxidoreductase [Nocardia wallacei]
MIAAAMPEHEVAILGGGFAGLGAGAMLTRAGLEDFVIIEGTGAIGGTWRDNVYPNVAVDVPSMAYQFSFEMFPQWSRVYAPGAEIRRYADHIADKYRLRERIRFDTTVERLEFDEDRQCWRVYTSRGVRTARYVISALGGLTEPKMPVIPGLASFRGPVVHSARWRDDLEVAGRRVALIGTGASGIQIAPWLAENARKTYVYQRTPIWVMPKADVPIPEPLRVALERIPPLHTALYLLVSAAAEVLMTLGAVYNRQLRPLTKVVEALGRLYIRTQVREPRLREQLTPRYGFGCKRPSMSNEYLRAFGEGRADLVTSPIEEVTATGIRTADGVHREVDAIVCATGFLVTEAENMPRVPTIGRGGKDLGKFWEEQRLQAYEGNTVPGFPNLFHTFAPYSVIGSSWLFMIEYQVTHAIRVITEARGRGAASAEIRREHHDEYFRQILRRMRNTVFFASNCANSNSYYFDRHGDAPLLRPSSMAEAWWRARHFDLDHYRYRTAISENG